MTSCMLDSCASSMSACLGSDLMLAAQAVDTEICVIKRQSMGRRCDVLIRAHQHSGCGDVQLSYETLRKRLGESVREYGYLMAAHADLHSLGVDKYPRGMLSDCGGCWGAAQPSAAEPSSLVSSQ